MKTALPRATIIDSEVRDLPSEIMGVTYQVSVWFPPGYANSDRKFPVIYLLDGDLFFGLVSGIVAGFVWGQVIPECLLVGVGHKITSTDEWWLARGVDLNPPENPQVNYPDWMDPFKVRRAPDYLKFIKNELVPFIEATYRADPADRCLAGYSLGGQFSIFAMFHEPGLFQRHFTGSGFWEHMLPAYQGYMDSFAQQSKSLPISAFFSVCSGEVDQYPYFPKFLDMLRKYKFDGFQFTSYVVEGENHSSGMASALLQGLRTLYAANGRKVDY